MSISQAGTDLIKDFEGFHAVSYLCPAKKNLTQGWGSTAKITAHSPPITRAEGEELLAKDLVLFERAVLRLCPVPRRQGQYDALVSFSFNRGAGFLKSSNLRRKIMREDYEGAPINSTAGYSSQDVAWRAFLGVGKRSGRCSCHDMQEPFLGPWSYCLVQLNQRPLRKIYLGH